MRSWQSPPPTEGASTTVDRVRREVKAHTVELCGPPGAGKSVIAGTLAEHLVARGIQVSQPLAVVAPTRRAGFRVGAKVLVASGELARAPVDSVRALAAIHRSNQSVRDTLHRSLNWLVVRGLYRRARSRPGIHVFDQGVVQELCSIGYQGGDWRACLTASGPGTAGLGPDLLIRVAASVETAVARLNSRPGSQSRLERLDVDERKKELERQSRMLGEIEQAWLERHGVALATQRIEVRNDDGQLAQTLGARIAHVIPAAWAPSSRRAGSVSRP
jgi:AAA domain